jgi:DNA binding domain, excisionase family
MRAAIPEAPPVPDGATLTIKDVCRRLNVNHQTVRALIRTGAIHYLRVGRVYRFREAWIQEFIDRAIEDHVGRNRRSE